MEKFIRRASALFNIPQEQPGHQAQTAVFVFTQTQRHRGEDHADLHAPLTQLVAVMHSILCDIRMQQVFRNRRRDVADEVPLMAHGCDLAGLATVDRGNPHRALGVADAVFVNRLLRAGRPLVRQDDSKPSVIDITIVHTERHDGEIDIEDDDRPPELVGIRLNMPLEIHRPHLSLTPQRIDTESNGGCFRASAVAVAPASRFGLYSI